MTEIKDNCPQHLAILCQPDSFRMRSSQSMYLGYT
jgi:hypothetical protein